MFPSVFVILIFLSSNAHIVGIEWPHAVWFPTFVVDDFSGLFLHPSTF